MFTNVSTAYKGIFSIQPWSMYGFMENLPPFKPGYFSTYVFKDLDLTFSSDFASIGMYNSRFI